MTIRNKSSSRRAFAVLEAVEVRRLLSTVVVNTLADETVADGTTSLREAVAMAAAGDTVSFAPGMTGTITLAGQQLLIAKDLTISGPGAANLSVSANNASRVIEVEQGVAVTLSGVTIKQGRAEFGGGIRNVGSLTLNNCIVSGNTAAGRNGTMEFPNGFEGWGGGIYNFGTLVLNNSVVTGNVAVGGSGGYGEFVGGGGPGFGGGILNGGGGSATLTNSTLSNNKAIGGSGSDNGFAGSAGSVGIGGAIYSDGADLYITGGSFAGNSAIGGRGTSGAVAAGSGGDARGGAIWGAGSLKNVSFTNNTAIGGAGGNVEDYYVSLPGGSAAGGAIAGGGSITRCTFANNVAAGGAHGGSGSGGAVYIRGGLAVTDSTFDSNQAVGTDADGVAQAPGGAADGGAISVGVTGARLSISGSTLSRNSALAGRGTNANATRGAQDPARAGGDAVGGAIALGPAAADATITRSTIVGNSVKGGAGGLGYDDVIWRAGDGGDARGAAIDAAAGLTLTASTIAGNSATAGLRGEQGGGGVDGQSLGGGVRGDGYVVLANTIVATNTAATGPDVSGITTSSGFNLIGKSDGSSGWIASDKTGTVASPLDPKLGAVAANGGPTKTMGLLAGSPALDAGKSFGLTTDQRGSTRPRNLASIPNAPGGDGSDIGAFELQALAAPVQTPFKTFVISPTPLTIQAEDFDNGGEGIAYHDADAANRGGAYRNSGVDLQPTTDTGGGVNLGWTKAGEWLEYTADVVWTGTYNLDFRVASNGAGGTFHLEVDGQNVTGPIAIPNTFGWQTWKTITRSGVTLAAGRHVLRLAMDTDGATTGWVGNFNYVKFALNAAHLSTTTAAHVRDGAYTNVNFGGSPTLEVKKSGSGYNREAYLKFDLSVLASITSARLRLYGGLLDAVAPQIQLGVFTTATHDWTEPGITWANKPTTIAAAVATATVSGTAKKWYEIDLTNFLKAEKAAGHQVVTLVLRSNTFTSTLCAFNSDEAANGPQLIIQT